MDILSVVVGLLSGGLLGYFLFYRRYENRQIINELRKYNAELKQRIHSVDHDRMEYEQQNILLKDEISILYKKTDDLTEIVSELSRYYYHLKKISSQMKKFSLYLQQPLADLDSKIGNYSITGVQDDEYVFDTQDDSFPIHESQIEQGKKEFF